MVNYSLYSVVFAGNKFVAGGDNGDIITSEDGIKWTAPKSMTGGFLSILTYGNGMYVGLCTSSNLIITSPDGVKWTEHQSNLDDDLFSVTFHNGQFIGAGTEGIIATSADAVTWVTKASGMSCNLLSITYGKDMFISVGDLGTILTSANGSVWEIKTEYAAPNNFNSVTYGNSMFVAAGDSGIIATSKDANTWSVQQSGTKMDLFNITYGNGVFAAIGDSCTVFTSKDGVSWSRKELRPDGKLSTIEYCNNLFITMGRDKESTSISGGGIIYISKDGVKWESVNPQIDAYLFSVSYGNGKYVAAGKPRKYYQDEGGIVLVSEDAKTWKSYDLENQFGTVVFGNGIFVATNSEKLVSSVDGITWEENISLEAGIYTQYFGFLAYGNSMFIATFYGGILTSPDASVWTKKPFIPGAYMFSIAHSSDLFVGVGGRHVLTSKADYPNDVKKFVKNASGKIGSGIKTVNNRIIISLPGLNSTNQLQAKIFAASGKQVFCAGVLAHGNIISLPAHDIAAGYYTVAVFSGREKIFSSPLIFQKR
jgi:hypothetical protein